MNYEWRDDRCGRKKNDVESLDPERQATRVWLKSDWIVEVEKPATIGLKPAKK